MIEPIPAQEALNDLVRYFMGEDWYISESLSQDQVNAIVVEDIKATFPKWIVRLVRFLFLGIL